MNKLPTLIAATFIALTALLGSGAEAGFNLRIKAPTDFSALHMAGCGGGGGFRSYRRASYQSVSHRAKRHVEVAERPAVDPVTVAKAQPAALPEGTKTSAEVENSSISTADGDVAAANITRPEKVAVAKDVGCKKFFASAGMTLSVPCE